MYPVTDMKRAMAFYKDGLGLKSGDVTIEYWAEFDIGGGTFGIGNFEQLGTAGTAQSFALEIADLAAFREKLKSAGYESSEPHDLPTCSIAVVADPDGNKIWLHEKKAGVAIKSEV